MTDIKLPAGYEDWVESEAYPADSERLRVMVDHFPGVGFGVSKQTIWFVPPKPKPVLPEVKPGAVIRFTDNSGRRCRAVRRDVNGESPICPRTWTITFRWPFGDCADGKFRDMDLLDLVNADGFTVELEGL